MNKQLNIIKRDGSVVKFDKTKIENAILKAMKYGSGIYEEEMAKEIADEIELSFNQTKDVATVNKVEDMVYKNLINHKHELTAKAYEGYRAVQSFKREVNTTDDSILGLL
ncbi:MAG: ATP cone domain-containing protein, partial [Peptostreptococcaceae bacterium]|nr:ATP cone domain-containing protein [Peptostreptococcaceae bacterium]